MKFVWCLTFSVTCSISALFDIFASKTYLIRVCFGQTLYLYCTTRWHHAPPSIVIISRSWKVFILSSLPLIAQYSNLLTWKFQLILMHYCYRYDTNLLNDFSIMRILDISKFAVDLYLLFIQNGCAREIGTVKVTRIFPNNLEAGMWLFGSRVDSLNSCLTIWWYFECIHYFFKSCELLDLFPEFSFLHF